MGDDLWYSSVFEIRHDGDSIDSGFKYEFSGESGTYYLHAYACDNKGNCSYLTSNAFYLDNTDPSVEVSSTNGANSSQTMYLSFSDIDSGLNKYSYLIPGRVNESVDLSGTDSSAEITVSDSATYIITVTDQVGNSSQTNVTFYRTILKVNGEEVKKIINMSGDGFNVPSEGIPDGYILQGWDDCLGNKKLDPYEYYMPTSNKTFCAILEKEVPADSTGPEIEFNPDGSDDFWVNNISSSITVIDYESEIDSDSLKYMLTQSSSYDIKNKLGNTFNNGESVGIASGSGIYYLYAYACNTYALCTSKKSEPFKLDAIKPEISISSTNDVSSSQTVTLDMSDTDSELASYSWGKYSLDTIDLIGKDKTITNDVNDSGTFTLTVRDNAGNENSTSITFYKTTLAVDDEDVQYIITSEGNGFAIPSVSAPDGHIIVGWKNENTEVVYDIDAYYTPESSTRLNAILEKSDSIAPKIEFGTNGSDSKYIKNSSSTIVVTDEGGSDVDESSLQFVFSTDINATPNSFYENYEEVSTPLGKTATYYLIAKACDNSNNCTTKISDPFLLDNTPPPIDCNNTAVNMQWRDREKYSSWAEAYAANDFKQIKVEATDDLCSAVIYDLPNCGKGQLGTTGSDFIFPSKEAKGGDVAIESEWDYIILKTDGTISNNGFSPYTSFNPGTWRYILTARDQAGNEAEGIFDIKVYYAPVGVGCD